MAGGRSVKGMLAGAILAKVQDFRFARLSLMGRNTNLLLSCTWQFLILWFADGELNGWQVVDVSMMVWSPRQVSGQTS